MVDLRPPLQVPLLLDLDETGQLICLPYSLLGRCAAHAGHRSVWRNAVSNLLHGKDPRRPFVKAFSDENLLGFFKYYVGRLLLECAWHGSSWGSCGSAPAWVLHGCLGSISATCRWVTVLQ